MNLDELLDNKINRRVVLKVVAGPRRRRREASSPSGRFLRRPSAASGIGNGWRNAAATSRRISGGRLGYVHMPDMSAGALAQLYVDLDAENIGARRRGRRHAEQQRRLRQRLCDRRAGAAAVLQHDAARDADVRRRARRSANARSSGRQCW